MSLTKTRLKILRRIAQETGAPAPDAPATATPADPPVAPPPAPTLRASEAYPSIRVGFDAGRVAIIDNVVARLNIASNTITNGKYNFQVLKNNNFQFDPSEFSSPDQKNLMLFFQKVFQTLLNRGASYTQAVSSQAINTAVQYLLQSPELANLSQVNPAGPIAQKIPGNFKDGLRELIARLQPTVPTQRR